MIIVKILFFVSIMCICAFICIVVYSTLYEWFEDKQKNKIDETRKKAFDDAGYIAEMWTINKYGMGHHCKNLIDPCKEIGELADELRRISKETR